MMKLDENAEEFRKAAHAAVDWIADYLGNIEKYPVLSRVRPGELKSQIDATAPDEGVPYETLLREFGEKIVPAITHWNHPGFMAYFSITGSQAGILGEMLSAALNVNGMLWRTSPAVTELEEITLAALREALGLPPGLFGIINDTASINTFLSLAAAREATGLAIRAEGMSGRTLPQMRVYCSDQAHSSVDKGALALGFGVKGVMRIESDAAFRMDVAKLREAVEKDVAAGVLPVAIVATTGTTATASVDDVAAIGEIARKHRIWLHVDAAYAGSATIDPRHRWIWKGIEQADSIVMNPHKWLFTPVDCSVLFTRRPDMLKETFSLIPEYLKTSEQEVINYMDYGVQLGRRFRALKLWMVMQHYGVTKMRAVIDGHIELAGRLAAELERRDDTELIAPQSFSVVVFRKIVRRKDGAIDEEASERASEELVQRLNATGEIFLATTRLRGKFAIRVAIGHGSVEWRHVSRILENL